MALVPSPDTVGSMLADPATRIQTLDALEQHEGPHDAALALATAPALTDLLCLDGQRHGVPHALYQRVGLLRGRLLVEAADPVAVWGVALGEGRYAREITAASVGMEGLRSKSAAELDRDDALSFACGDALAQAIRDGHGWTRPFAAAGFGSAKEFIGLFMAEHPIASAKRCPDDDKPIRMLTLLVGLLRSGEVPDLAIGGALYVANQCIQGRPAVVRVGLELGVIELVSAQLLRCGAPSEWLSTAYRPGKTIRGIAVGGLTAVGFSVRNSGSEARPDLDALESSGLLDQLVSALHAFEQGGVHGLQTTDIAAMLQLLSILRKSTSRPTANSLIRSAGSAIAFAMEHSLDFCEEVGYTTGSVAAGLCEN
eukprot:COSAG02_NODE_6_length_64796_cov_76.792865_18_plen_369_part_00